MYMCVYMYVHNICNNYKWLYTHENVTCAFSIKTISKRNISSLVYKIGFQYKMEKYEAFEGPAFD